MARSRLVNTLREFRHKGRGLLDPFLHELFKWKLEHIGSRKFTLVFLSSYFGTMPEDQFIERQFLGATVSAPFSYEIHKDRALIYLRITEYEFVREMIAHSLSQSSLSFYPRANGWSRLYGSYDFFLALLKKYQEETNDRVWVELERSFFDLD